MKVTVKLFALLGIYLPPGASDHSAEIEVAEDATPASVIDGLNLPPGMSHLVLLNGLYVTPDARDKTPLKVGDVIAIWPPVAGGSAPAPDCATRPRPLPVTLEREMSLTREEFLRTLARAADPALAAALGAPRTGKPVPVSVSGPNIVLGAGERRVEFRLRQEEERRLGSIRLPRMRIGFGFFGFTEDEVERFMARFDIHFRRGGG
jgi:sulfur carrier protein ThiS